MWALANSLALSAALLAPPPSATVVIDAGHGGPDLGARGVGDVLEKDLTLAYARALRDRIEREAPGVRVVMTRDDDSYPTLDERAWLTNRVDADVLVSVHVNAAENPAAEGVETFFLDARGTAPGEEVPGRIADGAALPALGTGVAGDVLAIVLDDLTREGALRESGALAERIQGSLIAVSGARDRGVRQGQFRVLRGVRAPAVVVELGFVSHAEEVERLQSPAYVDPMLDALAASVLAHVGWSSARAAAVILPGQRPQSDSAVAAR